MKQVELTINDFYKMVVEEEKLDFLFVEAEDGIPGISFSTTEDSDFLRMMLDETNLQDIAEKIIILASHAGLKEPTEFYNTIERYVKDEKLDLAKEI